MVVYSTDHGEQVGEHDLWWKQTFYEDSARVPGHSVVAWSIAGGSVGATASSTSSTSTRRCWTRSARRRFRAPTAGALIDLLKNPDSTPWEDVAFSEFVMYAQRDGLPFDVHSPPDGSVQRMVRYDEWKLNYYHGMRPQLFNLAEDPDETNDLAEDPAYNSIRDELIERVLDGWDPDEVTHKMSQAQQDQKVMMDWAKTVDPPDTYRWDLRPEMDYVDGP